MKKYESKYGARRTGTHASKKEHYRARQLRIMERAGRITGLREQVPFELIPAQYESPAATSPPSPRVSRSVAGDKSEKKGRLIERSCRYIADFVYTDAEGRTVVEDTKGFRTPDYIIKRKLMLWIHGIRILET